MLRIRHFSMRYYAFLSVLLIYSCWGLSLHQAATHRNHPTSSIIGTFTSIRPCSRERRSSTLPSASWLYYHATTRNNRFLLTTTTARHAEHDGRRGDSSSSSPSNRKPSSSALQAALQKFLARPGTYLLIPCVAAVVGWFTNWLAVQMIFYPVQFWGVPVYRRPEIPLGFLGWQGIVPCKTRPMTVALVEMVTSQLLTVQEAFQRLDPKRVAQLLAPEVPQLTQEIIADIAPHWLTGLPGMLYRGLDGVSQGVLQSLNVQFLERLTVGLQQNADSILNLQNCVVNQMMQDRGKLGELFRTCGQAELDFLTNSGLWFGFLLGLIQMVVALFWDNPWSLSIGGGIVGLATNWLALKWIFQPVDPFKLGPFVLQGKFLRRQKEVAAEFSDYFANNILTGEQLWHSILTDPETKPKFAKLFAEHFQSFVGRITRGFRIGLEPETVNAITDRALEKLPNHIPVIFPYMDKALGLQETLRVRMEQMTSRKFERVLHPIFEEDELTLILAGAALGFAAGLVQQGLETGRIQIPNVWKPFRRYVAQSVTAIRQWRPQGGRIRNLSKLVQRPARRVVAAIEQWKGGGKRKNSGESDSSD